MQKSECVLWQNAVNSSGYGVTWQNGRQEYAHRIVAGAKKGEVVLHKCDNKLCVNPEHLEIGSHKKNSEDMVKKNRQAKGVDAGNSKLAEVDVLLIRDLQGAASSRAVAKAFKISKTNVLDIWSKKIWKHL